MALDNSIRLKTLRNGYHHIHSVREHFSKIDFFSINSSPRSFIHLLMHAFVMFANECLGELQYEAIAPAIAMGSLMVFFLVDFFDLVPLSAFIFAITSEDLYSMIQDECLVVEKIY